MSLGLFKCDGCGKQLVKLRKDQRFCSDRCRKRTERALENETSKIKGLPGVLSGFDLPQLGPRKRGHLEALRRPECGRLGHPCRVDGG
jgi:hypothetical protein